jgi:hypothetical protein
MHLRAANSNRVTDSRIETKLPIDKVGLLHACFPNVNMLELMQEREAYASRLGGFGCRTLIWSGLDVGHDESPMRRALPLKNSGSTSLVNRKQVLPVFIGARVSTHYSGFFAVY